MLASEKALGAPRTHGRAQLTAVCSQEGGVRCTIEVQQALGLEPIDFEGRINAYAVIYVHDAQPGVDHASPLAEARSRVVWDSLTPAFDQTFVLQVAEAYQSLDSLRLFVDFWDKRRLAADEYLGGMSFPLPDLCVEGGVQGWFALLGMEEARRRYFPFVSVLPQPSSRRHDSSASILQETLSAEVLDGLSTSERRRQQAIHELVVSESHYLEELKAVLDILSEDALCSTLGLLSAEEYRRMFGSLRAIYDANCPFLRDLQRRLAGSDPGRVAEIGDVVCAHIPLLEPVYSKYCSEKEATMREIDAKRLASPRFRSLLAQNETLQRNVSLEGLRLTPIQRVARYPLLLKAISRHTAEDEESLRPEIDRAVALSQSLLRRVNARIEEAEMDRQLADIVAKTHVPDQLVDSSSLKAPSLRLLQAAVMVPKRSNRLSLVDMGMGKREKRRLFLVADSVFGPFLYISAIVSTDKEELLHPRLPLYALQVHTEDADLIINIDALQCPGLGTRAPSCVSLRAESGSAAQAFAWKIRSVQTSYAENHVTQRGIDEVMTVGRQLALKGDLTATEKQLLEAAILVEGLASKIRNAPVGGKARRLVRRSTRGTSYRSAPQSPSRQLSSDTLPPVADTRPARDNEGTQGRLVREYSSYCASRRTVQAAEASFADATARISETLESLVPEHRGRLQHWVEEECWPLMCQCPHSHDTFHDMWAEVCDAWWQQASGSAEEGLGPGGGAQEPPDGSTWKYLADNPNRRSVYV